MYRKITRGFILAIELTSLLAALILIFYAAFNSIWEVAAAALAVIAALISNFNSQRITWKQEDELLPEVFVDFDLKSINRMVLLIVHNTGGSRAYDIKLKFDPPLEIYGADTLVEREIPFLEKKQILQFYVYPSVDMFNQNKSEKRPS